MLVDALGVRSGGAANGVVLTGSLMEISAGFIAHAACMCLWGEPRSFVSINQYLSTTVNLCAGNTWIHVLHEVCPAGNTWIHVLHEVCPGFCAAKFPPSDGADLAPDGADLARASAVLECPCNRGCSRNS
jgi:hypothetical protein